MALYFSTTIVYLLLFIVSLDALPPSKLPVMDDKLIEFALNLEYLEAEFFLQGAMGKGLNRNLSGGGPKPIGVRRARLSPLIRDIIAQFGKQEVGHIKAIKSKISGFSRPLMDLSPKAFAKIINNAFGRPLLPPFDPYMNDINYLIASYMIPYLGLTGYVGANPLLQSTTSRKLVAGLLGVESGQDAVIRGLLYERAAIKVFPYGITVAAFTEKLSKLGSKLGHAGRKDRGLFELSKKGKLKRFVLAGNRRALSYGRTPKEILRIAYGTGKESVPGGFFPKGANGTLAKAYLKKKN